MKIEKDQWGDDKLVIETEEDFNALSNACIELYKRAAPIANVYLELKGIHPAWKIDEEDISLDGDGDLRINYSIGCRGYYEDESIHLPTKYLFDPNWVEEATKQIEEQKEKERQEEEKRKEAAAAKKKEQEYKKYLELKEQFEGGE